MDVARERAKFNERVVLPRVQAVEVTKLGGR
jgi:hypothetical protein